MDSLNLQSLNFSAAVEADNTIFALCMVVVEETPTRWLKRPRTPSQGAFIIIIIMELTFKETIKASIADAFADVYTANQDGGLTDAQADNLYLCLKELNSYLEGKDC